MPTQAQREANKRLQQKRDRISFWVEKDGTKQKIEHRAKSLGKSINSYLLDLVKKDMETE